MLMEGLRAGKKENKDVVWAFSLSSSGGPWRNSKQMTKNSGGREGPRAEVKNS